MRWVVLGAGGTGARDVARGLNPGTRPVCGYGGRGAQVARFSQAGRQGAGARSDDGVHRGPLTNAAPQNAGPWAVRGPTAAEIRQCDPTIVVGRPNDEPVCQVQHEPMVGHRRAGARCVAHTATLCGCEFLRVPVRIGNGRKVVAHGTRLGILRVETERNTAPRAEATARIGSRPRGHPYDAFEPPATDRRLTPSQGEGAGGSDHRVGRGKRAGRSAALIGYRKPSVDVRRSR